MIHSGASGAAILSIPAPPGSIRFGAAVAGIGDVNQDGTPDIAVGDPWALPLGRVFVFSGANASVIWQATGAALFAGVDDFGVALAATGDCNFDGVPDLAIGGSGKGPAACIYVGNGGVGVFSGATGALIFQVQGPVAGYGFGMSVAAIGDANGDGVTEIAVGAPGWLQCAGSAYVYSGASGALLRSFTTAICGEHYGFPVAAVGDFDFDGNAEVAIGAITGGPNGEGRVEVRSVVTGGLLLGMVGLTPNELFGNSIIGIPDRNNDGVRDLVVGAPGGYVVRVHSGLTGAVLSNFFGSAFPYWPGTALCTIGDLNGDSFPDYLVGDGAAIEIGRVYAVSGINDGILFQIDSDSGVNLLGAGIGTVGDLDGDGKREVLIGSTGFNGNGVPDSGRMSVYSGATGVLLFNFDGSQLLEQLGWSVTGTGDLDGDGVPDILVGAPHFPGPGRVCAVSGATGQLIYSVPAPAPGLSFGYSIASLGSDLDGDGVHDYAVGAPAPGTIGGIGAVWVLSGATGTVIRIHSLGTPYDGFGTSVAGAGDLDGDGVGDLLVGAPHCYVPWVVGGDSNALSPVAPGMVFAYSGASGALIRSWSGGSPFNAFGLSVASVGDINQDGTNDVIVGIPAYPDDPDGLGPHLRRRHGNDAHEHPA